MATKDAADGSARAVRGASLLILLQVISRAVTFIANQLLLRYLTAELLGVATQLEVYYLSVLFFARESLRVAIQRQDTGDLTPSTTAKPQDDHGKTNRFAQAAVNLGYLSILLGFPLAGVFGKLYLDQLSATTLESTPNLVLSLYVYALASVLELLSEPAFVVMQTRLQFGTRAAAESIATFGRCVVTLSVAIWGARSKIEMGVLPFAVGQLTYGVGLLVVYGWSGSALARREGFSLLPGRIASPAPPSKTSKGAASPAPGQGFVLGLFYRPTVQLASSMMARSVVKHILTQGDTFLVSILSTPTAQGVYALANNYGGLVARLLFQPIEESSRSYFSRLLVPSALSPSPKDTGSPDTPEKGGRAAASEKEEVSQHTRAVRSARSNLSAILKAYVLFSMVIVALGPTAAPLLLSLVAGPRWAGSGAGTCLAAYMWYIPLLAMNGVAEAFVASVATSAEVRRQSAWMGAFSLGFATAGFVFLRLMDLGAVGLVVANSINMACRIVWCVAFIRGYFRRAGVEFELLDLLPRPLGVLAAGVASQAVRRLVGTAGEVPLGASQVIMQLVRVAAVALPFVAIL